MIRKLFYNALLEKLFAKIIKLKMKDIRYFICFRPDHITFVTPGVAIA